jgi:gas vesicle protein
MLDQVKGTNGKILMAAIVGTTAGMIAGLLMAPKTGAGTRQDLARNAADAKDNINNAFKKFINNQTSQQAS